jgi:hypothetical protein
MRRFLFLVTIVAVVTIAAAGAASGGVSGARAVPVLPGSRTTAGPTLSVSSNLGNRRYAASGDRAYELGTEDGRYPAMGFHTRGEILSDTGKTQLMQRWWTGVTPMEAQLYPDGVFQPGLVPPSEALQLGSVAEQTGAMPEIGPSPDFAAKVSQPFNERSSLNQAWGTYGVLWPVVNQQLGVDPQLGDGLIEVLPDVPPGQSSVSGATIRVGTGSVDVAATHQGSSYSTTVSAGLACTLHAGAMVPAGATVHQVTLNGSAAHYTVRDTNAGREVLVSTPCRGQTWRVHVVAG